MLAEEVMETHGLVGQKSFTMKNSVKAFNILSDSLYMNKVLAVIRELSCNAADAQIEAGTSHRPFKIHLPDELAPFFFIRDFGTGLQHEDVLNLYTTYFDSTKSESADATGALGLGSKSPFAVVDDFTVVSYQNGKASTYFAYKNDEGFPCISFVSQDDVETEPNGIKIQFAVRKDKFADFRTNLPVALYHFEPKPEILNVPTIVKKEVIKAQGQNWEIPAKAGSEQTGYYLGDKPIIVMAKISYPLDIEQLRHLFNEDDLYLLDVCKVPIRIYVENRSVDHTPSREHLQYNKKTVATVRRRLKEIYDEIFAKVQEEFAECRNERDISERCSYLSKITKSNLAVDPWKSKKKVFGPKEFETISPIFSHPVLIGEYGKNANNSIYLHSAFSNCGISSYNRVSTVASMASEEFDQFSSDFNDVFSVWNRVEARSFDRYSSFNIAGDDELNEMQKAKAFKTINDLREANLLQARQHLRNRKVTTKHTVKCNSKFLITEDASGKKETTSSVDRRLTDLVATLNSNFVDLVFVIDDYPKEVSSIIRAGYARMLTRDHSDYVVFSNIPRSGGRFTADELKILETTVRNLAKTFNIKVIKGSEIVIPEIISKPEPRAVMDRSSYCAFNILQYTATGQFTETPADKMPEDFQLPGFDDSNVIFIRRQYNAVYLFGDEDSKFNISCDYKIGDAKYEDLEDLIRTISVFAGKSIIKNKVFVVIKTKGQYQKAINKNKSKWKSFTDVITEEVKKLSSDTVKQLAYSLILSRRNGANSFLGTADCLWSTIAEVSGADRQYQYREHHTAVASIMTGLLANWYCCISSLSEKNERTVEQINETLESLPDGKFKDFIEAAGSYLIKNEKLLKEHLLFQVFSSGRDNGVSIYSPRSLVKDPCTLQKIVNSIRGKEFVVHLNDFMLQCKDIVKQYPMLELFSTRFTREETTFLPQNVNRSEKMLKPVVDYVNLIEGANVNV
jgi:hypothetical protein